MPKCTYSREILQILESMWAKGVHNYSTEENKRIVKQVAAVTGLVEERVKVWIYSRNRRKKKKVNDGQMKRKKQNGSQKTMNMTVEDLRPGDAANARHAKPEETESSRAVEEMNLTLNSEYDEESSGAVSDLSPQNPEQQQESAPQLILDVEAQVQKLRACNCDVLFMVYNHNSGSLHNTGTPNGLQFLKSHHPGIHRQFAGAMSHLSCGYS